MHNSAAMRSHPIHPMLIVLPRGLWAFSLFCDLLYLGGGEAGLWSPLALYSMVGGFVVALAAVALPGFVELASLADRQVKRIGLAHMNLTLVVVALYAVNIWLRFSDPANMGGAIVLSAISVGVLAVWSWLGGERLHVHGVGVVTQPGAGPPADSER